MTVNTEGNNNLGNGNFWDELKEREGGFLDKAKFEELANSFKENTYESLMEGQTFRQEIRRRAVEYANAGEVELDKYFEAIDNLDISKIQDDLNRNFYGSDDGLIGSDTAYINNLWGNKILKGISGVGAAYKSATKGSISKARNMGMFGHVASAHSVSRMPDYFKGMADKIKEGNLNADDYAGFVANILDFTASGTSMIDGVIKYDDVTKKYKLKPLNEIFAYSEVAGLSDDVDDFTKAKLPKNWDDMSGIKKISKGTAALSALGLVTGISFLTTNSMKYDRIKDDPTVTQKEKDALIVSITADCIGLVSDTLGMIPNPVTQIASAVLAGINGIMKAVSVGLTSADDVGGIIGATFCALIPSVDYNQIQAAIKLKGLMDDAKYEEDKIVFENMYETAILKNIPVVSWFASLHTDKLRNDIKDEYGSLRNYYEKRFENLNSDRYNSTFSRILYNNPDFDSVQAFSGYTFNQVPEHIKELLGSEGSDVYFSEYSLDRNNDVVNRVKSYQKFTQSDITYEIDMLDTLEEDSEQYVVSNIEYGSDFNDEITKINKVINIAKRDDGSLHISELAEILGVNDSAGAVCKATRELAGLPSMWDIPSWSRHRDPKTYLRSALANLKARNILSNFVLRDQYDVNNVVNYALLNFVNKNLVNLNGGDDYIAFTQSHNRDQRYYLDADGGEGNDYADLSKLVYLNGELQKLNSNTKYTGTYGLDLAENAVNLSVNYANTNHRNAMFANLDSDSEELFRVRNFETVKLTDGTTNNVSIAQDGNDNSAKSITLIGGDTMDNVDFSGSTTTALRYMASTELDGSVIKGSQTENDCVDFSKLDSSVEVISDANHQYRVNYKDQNGNTIGHSYLDDIEAIVGTRRADTINGSEEADFIDGNGGADVVNAGGGDDTIVGRGHGEFHGGEGNDRFIMRGERYVETNYENTKTVEIKNKTAPSYRSSEMHSKLDIYGGEGEDIVDYSESETGIKMLVDNDVMNVHRVSKNEPLMRIISEVKETETKTEYEQWYSGQWIEYTKYILHFGWKFIPQFTPDKLRGIEAIIGSTHDDLIQGLSDDNYLNGNDGDDIVAGHGGNDYLVGGKGNDELHGGSGDDTLEVGVGSDKAYGDDGIDKFLIQENLDFSNTIDGGADWDLVDYSKAEFRIAGNMGYATEHGLVKLDKNSGVNTDSVNIANTETFDESNPQLSTNQFGSSHKDTLSNVEGIVATKYDDLVLGTNEDNYMDGNEGNDKLYGFGGNDFFEVKSGNDKIYGGSGDDSVKVTNANTSKNVIDGGSGTDTVDYSENENGRVVLMTDDRDVQTIVSELGLNLNAGYEDLKAVENVLLTAEDDIFVANDEANLIDAKAGDDRIYGYGGDDNITGNEGRDTIFGGDGDDKIILEKGSDTAYGENGDDVLFRTNDDSTSHTMDGGEGSDTVDYRDNEHSLRIDLRQVDANGFSTATTKQRYAYEADATFTYDKLKDIENVLGTLGDDIIHGNDEANQLYTSAGSDYLYGHGGDDKLIVDGGVSRAYGGAGDDVIELDAYKGYAYGEAGDDEIIVLGNENGVMSSENTIDGGDGIDTLNYSHLEGHIWGGLQTSVTRYGEIDGKGIITGTDTISNVENAVLTTGDDYLSGTNGNNVIRGNAGDDTIYGQDGDDRLYGDEGDDKIFGGEGDDTIFIGLGSDTVDGGSGDDRIIYEALESGSLNGKNTIDGGDGYDVVDYSNLKQKVEVSYEDGVIKVYKDPANKDANFDILRNVEGIVGTDFEDTIKGDALDNKLFGGKARDTIYGNDGHDEIYGGAGSDTIYGGSGDDVFHVIDGDTAYGEQGDDSFVIYKDESGNGTEFHGGEGVDTLEYSEVSYGISGNLSDGKFDRTTTYGGSIGVSDVVSNVENVLGTDYNDRIGGNDLDNRIEGNDGNDVLEGRAGEDTLKGGLGDDTLRGGADDDILNGGMGDDTLEGGAGNDTLKGGHGSDTYVFDGRIDGEVDNVYDFDAVSLSNDTGVDTINITRVLNAYEILFTRDGDNLVIKTKAGSRINVVNWFVDDVFKIENIQIYNGERVNLSIEKVELIMEGMALYEKIQGTTCEEAFNSSDSLYNSFINYLAKEETKEVMDLADDFTFLREYQNLVENSVKTYTGNFGNIAVDELSELSPSGVDAVGKIEFLYVPNAYNAFEYRYEREGNALTIHAGENSLKIGNWYAGGGNKVDIKIHSQFVSSEKIDFLVEQMQKYEYSTGVTWEQAINQYKTDYNVFFNRVMSTDDSELSTLENRYSFMRKYNEDHGIAIDDSDIFGQVFGEKLDYSEKTSNVVADLSTGKVSVGLDDMSFDSAYETDYIKYVDHNFTEQIKDIDTGSMADKVWGNALDNVINAGDGTNRVFGADGNDTITGGNMRDDFFGGNGDDTLNGRGGNDYLVGGAGNDKIYGEEGDDYLLGGSGDDILDGGAGSDTYKFFKDNSMQNSYGEEFTDSGSLGRDTIEDSGSERDTIELSGCYVNEFSFDMVGEDLVIGVVGSDDAITVKNFDSSSDKDYTLKYKYGNGTKEKDLGVLIEQIAAFEGTHGVQWEDVMGMERYQAQQQYGSDVYYAAEQIVL